MFRRHKSRFLKGFAWLFLALQTHLLWVAVAHSHELEEAVLSSHRVLRETHNSDSSAVAKSRYCVVCQIVRQSAVRPAVARPAPKPATLTRLGPGTSSAGFDSQRPAPTYGRAPPLT